MTEQQSKLKKKIEKGNPLSRQPSLVRKCTELTDICCNNSDRSMYCVSSFSRGLLKSNQECLEHFVSTVTSNLEFIPAAFKILTSIKCTGADKLRYNFILSEITSKIMDILNLNMQVMHPEIGSKPISKVKNENGMEVIEILDDADDVKDITIDSLEEINKRQNSIGNQVTSRRFRSSIVADKFFASIMKDLPSIDSGCDTVNTFNSNQANAVAFIDNEDSQTNQAVTEKSSDKNLIINKRDNADTLILSGIPSCQIKSEIVNLTETPDSHKVKSNGAKLNIFTPLETRQFPEDPPSEDVISNSEESFSIFDLRKKTKNSRKMPLLEPIVEINSNRPPASDVELAPKGNPDSNGIKSKPAASESLGSDKIKIHSVSKLNLDGSLKRKIHYPYKAKKKPDVDVNQSPYINIDVNSNKKKDMIVKEKLNSLCKTNVRSTKKASPKSVICDPRKKSKTFRKMPHLEPIIEISPDKANNTDLKLASKEKRNSICKVNVGSAEKTSTKSVINKNLQTSSGQPDHRIRLRPLPEESNLESCKRAKMQSSSKASKNSTDLKLTKMKPVSKTAIRSPINKKLKHSTEEDPQLDYRADSNQLSERNNLESNKGAEAAEKSVIIESIKMKSVYKAAVKSVVNKKLKPCTEEDPHPDYRANSKPFSERNNSESKKAAKVQSTSKAAEKSANLESTKTKSISAKAMKSLMNKKLKPTVEESRGSNDRTNLTSHYRGNNIDSINNTDLQSICKAAMKSVSNENLKLTTEGHQSGYKGNSKQLPERNIQPHFNVFIVPFDRDCSTTTKLNSYAEEVLSTVTENTLKSNTSRNWGSHNEGHQDQRVETTSRANLGTYTKESLGWNDETVRELKTKTCENNESLMEQEREDSSRETNFLTTIMRHVSSEDFDYDRNLLVLSRVSPYRESLSRRRGGRRGRGRGRGKSVTVRNEIKGEENAITGRCRGGTIKKPLGRQRGSGRGKVGGESSTVWEYKGIK